jgi:hypothetical protein
LLAPPLEELNPDEIVPVPKSHNKPISLYLRQQSIADLYRILGRLIFPHKFGDEAGAVRQLLGLTDSAVSKIDRYKLRFNIFRVTRVADFER